MGRRGVTTGGKKGRKSPPKNGGIKGNSIIIPHNPVPWSDDSRGHRSVLRLMRLGGKLKAGDNQIVRGSNEGIVILADNIFQLVRVANI